jgi:hypothetical protein
MKPAPKQKRGGVPGNKGGKGAAPKGDQKLVRVWTSVRPDVAAWLATKPQGFLRDLATMQFECAELRAGLAKVSDG